jgi:putative thioredoxin
MFSDTASAPPADLIKDGSDATFMTDVVEASKVAAGHRRFLGDLVRAVPDADADAGKGRPRRRRRGEDGQDRCRQEPGLCGPAAGPVDPHRLCLRQRPAGRRLPGRGARQPDQGLHRQADRRHLANGDIEQLLSLGEESLVDDLGGAAQAFAQVLQLQPDNEGAIAGMARVYLADGDVDQARQTIAMAPAGLQGPGPVRPRPAVAGRRGPAGAGRRTEGQGQAADPNDHQARFDLALALAASGDLKGPVDSFWPSSPPTATGTTRPRASSCWWCSRPPAQRRTWRGTGVAACPPSCSHRRRAWPAGICEGRRPAAGDPGLSPARRHPAAARPAAAEHLRAALSEHDRRRHGRGPDHRHDPAAGRAAAPARPVADRLRGRITSFSPRPRTAAI